ncbi:universal stress protein family protein [Hirsutella rhossiliensis]|uniref:Universal stress protein family domain-containing protein n=1 Tax=Hirsutella rhossiliensis TaxID=111463 RepID=A0A9P8SES4_9HYPO|nr:universal stress protein family domain-containing protein [Hirsutella rhossiliensis]KAH0959986.1 universal stress protein family domain-containing protein [Hirsutella rhossiliensis]
MDSPRPSPSPESDVSPMSSALASKQPEVNADYFSSSSNTSKSQDGPDAGAGTTSTASSSATVDSPLASTHPRRKSSVSFPTDLPKSDPPAAADDGSEGAAGRKSSASSITFRPPKDPSLPQGHQRQTGGSRIRASSPPYQRFQQHVGFDNLPSGEATKNNTLSLTLNVRHKGYQARRRSRTFMVGVDEHSYSDYAIQWLLDELVDDGDEIVCVRVNEKEIRCNDKQYLEEANQVMEGILAKNAANRAISFTLEYSVGKLHATFQKLIQMYQPAMLVVGTRGRSLGGIQGLVNSRNSFSKYCLQYSPVPVVVVRPTEKRIKKKVKRANDSTRQTYLSMLAATHGRHEADSEASSTYELEIQNSPDEEAHQVAKVLGLPAKFDPTIKPLASSLRPRSRPSSPPPSADPQRAADASPTSAGGESYDDDDDDDDAEFEVTDGRQALNQQQKLAQLHKMEAGEAAALRQRLDEDDEDESDKAEDKAGDKPEQKKDAKNAS